MVQLYRTQLGCCAVQRALVALFLALVGGATATAAADPSLATTGADSTTITGLALLLLGFGMLAVAGQRTLAFRHR